MEETLPSVPVPAESTRPVSTQPQLPQPDSSSPEPSLATPASTSTPAGDPSIAEFITGLEKQVITNMDSIVDQLRSLQQAGSLDNTTLKEQVRQVLGLAKASLVIRTLPILLNTLTITFSLEISEL